ncbi:unnamed protein product [Didymodactylos carnosus]|uniref:Uncharacterized protein n=1 Tax=Didymodactylos carnosus TaxID=1234261 RepID=A0A8S3A1E0_9BILA|nr:unnamed protein product [Didymodactylos carnosus]
MGANKAEVDAGDVISCDAVLDNDAVVHGDDDGGEVETIDSCCCDVKCLEADVIVLIEGGGEPAIIAVVGVMVD